MCYKNCGTQLKSHLDNHWHSLCNMQRKHLQQTHQDFSTDCKTNMSLSITSYLEYSNYDNLSVKQRCFEMRISGPIVITITRLKTHYINSQIQKCRHWVFWQILLRTWFDHFIVVCVKALCADMATILSFWFSLQSVGTTISCQNRRTSPKAIGSRMYTTQILTNMDCKIAMGTVRIARNTLQESNQTESSNWISLNLNNMIN